MLQQSRLMNVVAGAEEDVDEGVDAAAPGAPGPHALTRIDSPSGERLLQYDANGSVVQMDALYDESRRDELLMTPLDRGAEANWLQRLVVGHMECCGQSTRPVCEWPLPAPAAGP